MVKKPARAAAKGAGAAKQATARLGGDAGVLNTLAKEHAEVRATLGLVRTVRKRDPKATQEEVMDRVRILDDLVLDLVSHAMVEDELIYARLERYAPDLIRDGRGEHRRMEELLHQLLSVAYSSDRWLEAFEELEELVGHHVDEEEDELFRVAQEHLSKAELKELDEQFQQKRAVQRDRLRGGAFALPRA